MTEKTQDSDTTTQQSPQISQLLAPVFQAPPAVKEPVIQDVAAETRPAKKDKKPLEKKTGKNKRNKTESSAQEPESPHIEVTADAENASTTAGTRKTRKRRRGESDLEMVDAGDPPNTVTKIRAPRNSREAAPPEQVTAVKGSTRLEAKRQRRRESREQGKNRQGVTEAEFQARREEVDRQMVVRQSEKRIQIGVLEDETLVEHFVSNTRQDSLIGNIYLGKVQNVLPSMEAAFIDIGRSRNAVLYAGEVDWESTGLSDADRRIENAFKAGDPVLVQVTKDEVGQKGARLTKQISLPGRYLVYVPGGGVTGISRKLPEAERQRLKRILKENLPKDSGIIVRTAAEGASEQELINDINRLQAQWEDIHKRATAKKTLPPESLHTEPDLTIKVVRDVFNEDFSKLVIAGEDAWDMIEAYVTYVAPDLLDRLEKWSKEEDIFAEYRIDESITKALSRKVYLPSGGSLVIDRTEAMTVVDVNTGKFVGSGGDLEETVTKNNLEAAEEVVRQLRLRDIGGIIVVDFIDMVLESNKDLVLHRLIECLGRDRSKHQVAEVTSLGLVQMTRKRIGTGLLEVFGTVCETCQGRGVVTGTEPVTQSHQHQGEGSKRKKKAKSQPKPPEPVEELSEEEKSARSETSKAAIANMAAALVTKDDGAKNDSVEDSKAPVRSAELVQSTDSADPIEPAESSQPGGAVSSQVDPLSSLDQAFDAMTMAKETPNTEESSSAENRPPSRKHNPQATEASHDTEKSQETQRHNPAANQEASAGRGKRRGKRRRASSSGVISPPAAISTPPE